MAHLLWSRNDYGWYFPPERWSNVDDVLPPAFRVQGSEHDTPAMARAALLSRGTPCNTGGGKLYVGDSKSAVQWAGQHVAYIINCADINYAWHPWCPRFWLNVGYGGEFEDRDWAERMMTAVKIVLLALMFGQNVLIHCRQGKHRSGAFCVLILALMWECSVMAALRFYWSKRPDLEDHDWWVLDKILFRKNNFDEVVERVREQSWFPKARGNILNRLWAFTAKSRSNTVEQPTWKPPPPKKRPRPASAPPGARKASTRKGDQRPVSSFDIPDDIELEPRRKVVLKPRQTSSSSSVSTDWLRVHPCHTCARMPWSCKCNPGRRLQLMAAFSPHSTSTPEPVTEPQISAELFRRMSMRSGVWADAEAAEHRATELRDRSRSPSPEVHDKEGWQCPQCTNLNSKHILHCETTSCGLRRGLVQHWRQGDYYCRDCGNHRFASSLWCNWVHCHSNDWTCPVCHNLNFAAREKCHTRSCGHPRDWICPSCGLENWIVRPRCKDCRHARP